ncbi:MAG: manganese efflux pump [Clostridiales bacterium]|nr:manganese efflux pump [Clostridiales bacterium]
MKIYELFLISLGLGMDAFAVSICKGISMKNIKIKKAIKVALYFGVFQAAMPLIGYLLGKTFENIVVSIDHWIAFVLLEGIGINMIKEAFSNKEEDNNEDISFKVMSILALATSIDALAIGITFAFFKVNIIFSIILIGFITFSLCFGGVYLGSKCGDKFKSKSEIFGGIILMFLGAKILIEHLIS